MLAVFALVLLLWLTGEWHGISATTVACLGVCLLLLDARARVAGPPRGEGRVGCAGLVRRPDDAGGAAREGRIPAGVRPRVGRGSSSGWPWWWALVALLVDLRLCALRVREPGRARDRDVPGVLRRRPSASARRRSWPRSRFGVFSSLNAATTHYGTGPAPIVFGAGYVTQAQWWRIGFLISLVHLAIWLPIGFLWWKIDRPVVSEASMKTYRVAVIPGDGIGQRSDSGGDPRARRGRGAQSDVRVRVGGVSVGIGPLPRARPDDAGRRARSAAAVRRDLLRRRRRSAAAGQRHAQRPAAADPPRLRSVRVRAAGGALPRRALPARRHGSRRHRLRRRAREHRRASTRRSAACCTRADRTKSRCRRRCSRGTAPSASSGSRSISRAGADRKRLLTSVTKSNAQGFSMAFWDRVFADVARDYPDIRTESLLVDAACMDLVRRPAGLRRHRRLEPVRRHPDRPQRRHHRQPRSRAEREPEPGADVSLDVRAGARLGAGHRRPRHRQSDGDDAGRVDDAGFPRRRRRRRRSVERAV